MFARACYCGTGKLSRFLFENGLRLNMGRIGEIVVRNQTSREITLPRCLRHRTEPSLAALNHLPLFQLSNRWASFWNFYEWTRSV